MKASYKFLGLGILTVGLIAAAGIYLKGDGSQVQGAFTPTPATLSDIPLLKVSQGSYISAAQSVSEGKRVPVLAFNLTPGGSIKDEDAFIETMSFDISSSNLSNNFGNKSSWSLYSLNEDGGFYCSYEIGSVSYSGSVLSISMEGGTSVPEGVSWSEACYSTISTASSLEVDGETAYVLTLNVEKSSAAKMASLKINTKSSGWLWYDDAAYIFMPEEELSEHTHRTVNGSAEVSTKVSMLN